MERCLNRLKKAFHLLVGTICHFTICADKYQPRPQGLLAFQNGGGSGEDPGTQQITCLQRGWRCIQNGGYGEKGEKNWVRDAKVKINKWRKKLKFSSRKNRKNRHVLHVRVLGIRQSVRGLVFAVHCFFFVILKLGVMGLSVLYCGTPYRYLIQCCSSEHYYIFVS